MAHSDPSISEALARAEAFAALNGSVFFTPSVASGWASQLEALPQPSNLDEATSALASLGFELLPPPRPRRARPGHERPARPQAVRMTGPVSALRAAAWGLHAAWAGDGVQVFVASDGFGGFPPELGLLSTADPNDMLRCQATRAFGEGQEALLAVLRDLHSRQPFVLAEVHAAALHGYFVGDVVDPESVVEILLAACPPWGYGVDEDEARAAHREAVARGLLSLAWDDPR